MGFVFNFLFLGREQLGLHGNYVLRDQLCPLELCCVIVVIGWKIAESTSLEVGSKFGDSVNSYYISCFTCYYCFTLNLILRFHLFLIKQWRPKIPFSPFPFLVFLFFFRVKCLQFDGYFETQLMPIRRFCSHLTALAALVTSAIGMKMQLIILVVM